MNNQTNDVKREIRSSEQQLTIVKMIKRIARELTINENNLRALKKEVREIKQEKIKAAVDKVEKDVYRIKKID